MYRAFIALLGLLALAACAGGTAGNKPSQRPVPLSELPSMRVVDINVTVPPTLTVSEANSFKPRADIVWREDPLGDRYEQVRKIVEEGIAEGAKQLDGDVPVILNVVVTRFHALTERTRYSIGGEQEIEFTLEVVNADTGEVIVPAYPIDGTFMGYGGDAALVAEHLGNTQKVRIKKRLEGIILQELAGIPAPPVP